MGTPRSQLVLPRRHEADGEEAPPILGAAITRNDDGSFRPIAALNGQNDGTEKVFYVRLKAGGGRYRVKGTHTALWDGHLVIYSGDRITALFEAEAWGLSIDVAMSDGEVDALEASTDPGETDSSEGEEGE